MSRTRNMRGLAVVVLGILLIYSLLPLGTALQFGGDEGYQLITGFLMSKGFVLYRQVWYDQPPVLVLLLQLAFKMFGPSIVAARVIAAGFGMLMFVTFYQIVKLSLGQWPAILAAFFLLASPGILQLSVSVMQEVPAFALVLVSVLLLLQSRKPHHQCWLWASGVAMGFALGIKLTAALVLPAMIVDMLVKSRANRKSAWFRDFAVSVLQWGAAAAITFMLIILVWGQGSLESSYRAHFTAHPADDMPRPEDFPVPVSVFVGHAECVVAAAAGIILIVQGRRMVEFALPSVWLATALAIHSIHRPWWMYYYLHLAIPMAWFAGFAVGEITRPLYNLISKNELSLSRSKTWKALAFCTLAALALVRSELRVEGGVKDLQARTRLDADPVLSKMKEYAAQTRWVYVQYTREAYAFHARLPMPPELAVVSLKRYWSGQVSTEEIVNTCSRYRPEQLLLSPAEITHRWRDLLTSYSVVYQDKDNALCVVKSALDKDNRRASVSNGVP